MFNKTQVKNMGRTKQSETTTSQVQFDKEYLDILDNFCTLDGRQTRTDAARRLIKLGIDYFKSSTGLYNKKNKNNNTANISNVAI